MNFLKRFSRQAISPSHIEDFYKYSEAARCSGKNDGQNTFGSGLSIESTRENGKETYCGIMLYCSKSWAHVSVENGAVKYQYTENGNLRDRAACPVTRDEREIALITNAVMKWYKAFGLPEAIDDAIKRAGERPKVFVVNEIDIDGFDDEFPPVLRVFNNKTTSLILGIFPPRNKKISKKQANHFERLLADATGKKVVHDDRETFVIFDDSPEMIERVISFLQTYGER